MISGQTAGFRLRARLAIRGRLGSPKLGLFELGTHRVVHIPNCSVQHPLINRVAAVVRRALVDARVTSYSDKAHLGLARYLQVVVERSSQTAQVVMVGNCATAEPFAACFELIRERLGASCTACGSTPISSAPISFSGPNFQNWCGPAERGRTIWRGCGALPAGRIRTKQSRHRAEHHRARARPNPAGRASRRILRRCRRHRLVGVGSRPASFDMNEVSPHSLHGLELGLAQLDPANRAKISVVPGPGGRSAPGRVRRAGGDRRPAAQGPRPRADRAIWASTRPSVSCT